jgi:hypothetical protein
VVSNQRPGAGPGEWTQGQDQVRGRVGQAGRHVSWDLSICGARICLGYINVTLANS